MIFKTAIALLLTASLAGSAVYFGTQSEGEQNGAVSLGQHPHVDKVQTLEDDADSTEIVKVPLVEESQTASAKVTTIERLLNRSRVEVEPGPTAEKMVETVDTEVSQPSDTRETQPPAQLHVDDPEIYEDEIVEQEALMDDNLGATEIAENSPMTDSNFKELNDADDTIELVMAQIAKMESPEIQDQAYFEVVEFALGHRKYVQVGEAISRIENVRFRDTARGQHAVALAKDGLKHEAFTILEGVEVKDMRDLLRLKVIEAIIEADE